MQVHMAEKTQVRFDAAALVAELAGRFPGEAELKTRNFAERVEASVVSGRITRSWAELILGRRGLGADDYRAIFGMMDAAGVDNPWVTSVGMINEDYLDATELENVAFLLTETERHVARPHSHIVTRGIVTSS